MKREKPAFGPTRKLPGFEDRKRVHMYPVTFATSCWENDWRPILLDPTYLPIQQIGNHLYDFAERLLIINNVHDLALVKQAAQRHLDTGALTRLVIAEELAPDLLPFFALTRSDFPNDWVYYNALAPLAALYACQTDFLLYQTGDVRLERPISWIPRALARMCKNPLYKVANLTWNDNYAEARRESTSRDWYFYIADRGFSDQMFLVPTSDLRQPIYHYIHPDSHHYPRGDVFEKRAFSAMIPRGWKRITYRRGSYLHRNF